jgi:hypothetical protein
VVGSSSTRPSATGDTPSVTEAGVDTWRLLFRTTADDRFEATPFDVGRYKAQWFPGLGALALEGHPGGDALCEPWSLELAYQTALGDLAEFGHVPVAFRGIARLDSTVTQAFPDPLEGRAALAGIAALDLPRCEQVIRGRPVRSVQIVHVHGRAILGRAYDKGVESGTASPGELIRLEDQRRYPSGRRPQRSDLHAEYVKGRFEHRFAPLWRSAKGVKVAGVPVLARELADRVRGGELSVNQAERLGGYLLVELGGAAGAYPRRTAFRRRAALRDLGLVVADDVRTAVEVDLGQVLERALETPMWGARG